MAIQRWLYGVRGASLHSVASRFRFDVFGRALLFIGPIWLTATVVLNTAAPPEQTYRPVADLVAILALTLLLTPLQSAGEEYGLRGLVLRIAASWSRGSRTALVVGVLVSSLVFTTTIHGASNPWINLWYFTLAAGLAVITWRTGGIASAPPSPTGRRAPGRRSFSCPPSPSPRSRRPRRWAHARGDQP